MCKQTIPFIFLSLLLSFWFLSCKKDSGNNNPANTISVSIDGEAATFNQGAKATVLSVSGGYGINVEGYKKDPDESQTKLSFSIVSPTPITPGTYTENAGNNPLVTMIYDYDLLFGIVYTSEAYLSTTHPVTITITSISSASIKGTFSGELYAASGPSGTPYTNILTGGTFNANF